MSYDPNGPLAVRPPEEWLVLEQRGYVICDPFVQAGVENAPKAPLEPGQFPAAFEESAFLSGGFKFWPSATETFPDLEMGVLVTEGNHPDDLDGPEMIDEFEEVLVARAGFVGYGLGNRFETDAEAEAAARSRAAYGRRIEDACNEYDPPVPAFNLDPVLIPGVSTGPVEDLLTDMDDKVRVLAFRLGREHGFVKAAILHARHMWQIHAVGMIGLNLKAMQQAPEGPGLIVVSKDQLGIYPKLVVAIGDPVPEAFAGDHRQFAADDPEGIKSINEGPRVAMKPMHAGVLPARDTAWDDAAALERGVILPHEYRAK